MANKKRLDSWKEISQYLHRSIRTCYRWRNRLGLPIYPVNNKSIHSKVFSYENEIDEWFKKRAYSYRRQQAGRKALAKLKGTRKKIRNE